MIQTTLAKLFGLPTKEIDVYSIIEDKDKPIRVFVKGAPNFIADFIEAVETHFKEIPFHLHQWAIEF